MSAHFHGPCLRHSYIRNNVDAAPDEPDDCVPLRMNNFPAVTASHLDCADLLLKSKTTRLLGMKQDMKKTQETSQCRGGSVLWTRKVTQSGNC